MECMFSFCVVREIFSAASQCHETDLVLRRTDATSLLLSADGRVRRNRCSAARVRGTFGKGKAMVG